MSTYLVEDPETGLSATLEGDSPPSEQELVDIFRTLNVRKNPPSLRTDIPVPGESIPTVSRQAPTALEFGQPASLGEQAAQVRSTDLAKVEANRQALEAGEIQPERIGEKPIEIPRFGEEGSFTRGVSEVVSGLGEFAANKPEEIVATLFPPTAIAIGARYGPEIVKQWFNDIRQGIGGDEQASGRAIAMLATVAGPIGAKHGLSAIRRAKLDIANRGLYDSMIDKIARESLAPENATWVVSQLPKAEAPKTLLPITEAAVKEVTKSEAKVQEKGLPKVEENKPAQLPTEQAAPIEPQAAVPESPAKAPGATTPEAPPAISETKPASQKTQITQEAVDLLNKVDAGSVPAMMTANLRRVATENGIEVTDKTTPNEIVQKLRTIRDNEPEYLVSAAIRLPDGEILEGNIHAMAAAKMTGQYGEIPSQNFGYTTTKGRFISKWDAQLLGMERKPKEVANVQEQVPVEAAKAELPKAQDATPVPPQPSPKQGEQAAPVQGVGDVAQPEIVGMGGAVPGEFIPEPRTATGIKNAAVDAERQRRGQEPIMRPARLSNQVVWDRVMARIDREPDWQDLLIRELKDKPRNLNQDEVLALDHRYVDLQNEYAKATRDAAQAYDDGRMTDVTYAKERIARWEEKLNEIEEVAHKVGTEWGRAGQMRQRLMKEDFTLASMEMQKRKAKGFEPLTDAERAEIKRQFEEYQTTIAKLEAKVGTLSETAARAEAERVLAEIKAQEAARPKYSPKVLEVAEKFATYMDQKGADALSRIRERARNLSAGIDPTLLTDVGIYGASKITRGVVEFAKWSDEMVRDVGEWIKPHLKQAWALSNKALDKELEGFKPRGVSTSHVKKAIKAGTVQDKRENIVAKIKAKVDAGELSNITPLARKLARSFAEEGIRTLDPMIDAVHGVLKDIVPDLTRRETMDALSGYGVFKQLSKDEIDVILRDIYGQAQQVAKLEDMAAGKAPKKTGWERRHQSDEERRLIKQVNEKKKEGGYTVTDPETQLRTAMQAVKTRLENQIKDLEQQISSKQKIVKERRTLEYDAEAEALRQRRNELQEQYDAMFPKEPLTDAQRLQQWKDNIVKRMAKYEKRIAEGDYAPRKKPEIKFDQEALDLEFKAEQIQKKFYEGLLNDKLAREKLLQRGWRKTQEGVNTLRAILTSADFSAVRRQGGLMSLAHPVRSAKGIPDMIAAFKSEKAQFAVEKDIRTRENYPLYKQAGLELTEIGAANLTKMEEAYMSRLAGKIPIVAGSQRAYVTFLNKLRADSFDALAKTLTRDGKPTLEEARVIANYINLSTGRGKLPIHENLLTGMSTLFFAPRYVLSRFQMLAGYPLWYGIFSGKAPLSLTLKVRGLIALDYARMGMGLAVIYGLAQMAANHIEFDSNSSDFGKIRIGDTRIDPLSGLAQATVFLSRLITGKKKTLSGKTVPLRGKVPYGQETMSDVITRFGRSKLAPVPGAVWDVVSGEDVMGRKVTPGSLAWRLSVPINWQDVDETMKEQGVPAGTALSIWSMLGDSVQTYEDRRP